MTSLLAGSPLTLVFGNIKLIDVFTRVHPWWGH